MEEKKAYTEKKERGRSAQALSRQEYRAMAEDARDFLQNEPAVTWTQDVYAAQEDVFAGETENL
ncbi:MAG TPA: hypothetical protein DEA44_05960 [Firmicutes bacterium]|nr:hypothetical protein [Bacillota bacterium]HWR55434.1 hypothetical protein [Negativicutes bacterium]